MPVVPPLSAPDDLPPLDGTWERRGRSIPAAAIVGALGIGAVYFNVQGLLTGLTLLLTGVLKVHAADGGNSIDNIAATLNAAANPIRAILLVTQFLLLLLPTLWIVRRWHSSHVRAYIRLRPAPIAVTLAAILSTLTSIPAANFISSEIVRHLGVPEFIHRLNGIIFLPRSSAEYPWVILVLAVTPALCEEILFRGYVQRTLERTMGWKSVLVAGVLFGLFHLQPAGLVTLSLIGILLGYFAYRSRSLVPAMAGHFTNNLIAIVALSCGLEDHLSVPWTVASTIVTPFFLYAFHLLTSQTRFTTLAGR